MPDQNPDTIAVIRKNANEEIRVSLTKYRGLDLVDARVYADNGSEHVATKKGICVHVNTLPLLIEGLQQAEAEARKLGQITDRKDREGGS